MRTPTHCRGWTPAEDSISERSTATMRKSPSLSKTVGSPSVSRGALQRLAGANSPMMRMASPSKRQCTEQFTVLSPRSSGLHSPVASPTAASSRRGLSRSLQGSMNGPRSTFRSLSGSRLSPITTSTAATSVNRSRSSSPSVGHVGDGGKITPLLSPGRQAGSAFSPTKNVKKSTIASPVRAPPASSAVIATTPTRSPSRTLFQSPVIARIEARRRAASARKAMRGTPGSARKTSRVDQMKAAGNLERTWSGLRPRQRTSRVGCPAPVSEEEVTIPEPPRFDCGNPLLNGLCSLLLEIEPPTGVLRIPLKRAEEVEEARARVTDGTRLINEDLRAAATAIGQPTIGPLFQALLCRHASIDGPSGAMYASRDDRAGGAELDLSAIADTIEPLSRRCVAVVQLLRIKLEDDGDLHQASKTLRDISNFFEQMDEACTAGGLPPADALAQMRL
eukprot:m.201121 g.201121  ORF g.201121 m.201121 type:complete len:449 (-) comp15342_c0_seq2:4013-5359(-)